MITKGTQPAAAPVVPRIAGGSQIVINIGFNGANLVLAGPGAKQGTCVDALGQSVIGQVAACNARGFFETANSEISSGTITVPPLGTASDGQACPSTEDYAVVDEDPSDNVNSTYLINGHGQTAQDTTANAQAMAGDTVIENGSDNALLDKFLDPALGCAPFTAPSVTTPGGTAPSQALNELSAAANQQAPIALVPPNDEMVLVNGSFSLAKMNVYRALADQPPAPARTNLTDLAGTFCQNLVNIAPARDQLDMSDDAAVTSPDPASGDNLATLLGNRLNTSFRNLNCHRFGLTNPVGVALDGKGTAVAVAYNTLPQVARSAPLPGRRIDYSAHSGRHATPENEGVNVFIAVIVLVIAGLAIGIVHLRRRVAGQRAAPADAQPRARNSATASQRVNPRKITEQLAPTLPGHREPLVREYDAGHGTPPRGPAAGMPGPPASIRLRQRRRPGWPVALLVVLAAVIGPVTYHVVASRPAGSATAAARKPVITAHQAARQRPAPANTTARPAARHGAAVVISLTAVSEACWADLTTSSGATIFQGIIDPGPPRTWREPRKVTLQLGNPGAITLTVNGNSRTGLGPEPVTLSLAPGQTRSG